MFWLWILLAVIGGATVGAVLMAAVCLAGNADRREGTKP
jgi:hypothetical protein